MTVYPPANVHVPLHKPGKKSSAPWLWVTGTVVGVLVSPLLWFGWRELQNSWLEPEAILVLGGENKREKFAAQLAAKHPKLHVWVSGGAPTGYARNVFTKEKVSLQRVHLDYHAIDTLTNFTTMVGTLEKAGIKSVYLVTSDDHMSRSRLVGEIVFGSRGIAVKPVSFVSGRPDESWQKVWRDGARAVMWVFTGKTGASWAKKK